MELKATLPLGPSIAQPTMEAKAATHPQATISPHTKFHKLWISSLRLRTITLRPALHKVDHKDSFNTQKFSSKGSLMFSLEERVVTIPKDFLKKQFHQQFLRNPKINNRRTNNTIPNNSLKLRMPVKQISWKCIQTIKVKTIQLPKATTVASRRSLVRAHRLLEAISNSNQSNSLLKELICSQCLCNPQGKADGTEITLLPSLSTFATHNNSNLGRTLETSKFCTPIGIPASP